MGKRDGPLVGAAEEPKELADGAELGTCPGNSRGRDAGGAAAGGATAGGAATGGTAAGGTVVGAAGWKLAAEAFVGPVMLKPRESKVARA